MKNIVLLAFGGLFFAGCSKEIKTTSNDINTATLVTSQEEATRTQPTAGIKPVRSTAKVTYKSGENAGWILMVNSREYVMPLNLPGKYAVENLLVDVSYIFTNKTIPCNCENPAYYVEIKSIKTMGSQPD